MAIQHPTELADTLPELERVQDMVQSYPAVREYVEDVFPIDQNEEIQYPPEAPEDFQRNLELSPSFQQAFAQELWTLLNEIEADGYQYNGKELYDHQLAHLWFIASSIASGKKSPQSFFIEGAPGSGKTLTLGILMQATIRMQIRGSLEGKIAYTTAKPYHLAAKVRGKGSDKARVLRAPPYTMSEKDFNRIRLQLAKKDKMDIRDPHESKVNDNDLMTYYFPKKAWDALYDLQGSSENKIKTAIINSLKDRELHEDFVTEQRHVQERFIRTLTLIIAGKATLVPGPNKTVELIELPEPPATESDQMEAHTGDAGAAIPVDYPVYSRESTGLSNVERADAHVILEPANVFTSAMQIERHGDVIHKEIVALFCDEAQRRNPLVFQNPVLESGGKKKPAVFAAGSQWYGKDYDLRTPSHTMLESIRRGVLPSFGVHVFPNAQDIHFPSETREAFEQMVRAYFEELPLLKKLNVSQPYDSNTLVVVHGRLIDETVNRLRREYSQRNIGNAEIHPYLGTDEEREALSVWFDDEEGQAKPHVLVATPATIKESIDLQTLRHLVVGAKVSSDVLFHLVGRIAHGRDVLHPKDRMLLTMQQFENSNLKATPFVAFNHGQEFPDSEFQWVPGHALMNDDLFKADEKLTNGTKKKYHPNSIPSTAQRKRGEPYPIPVQGGNSMIPGNGYIDPNPRRATREVSAGARRMIPMAPSNVMYDKKNGPPTRAVVEAWAEELDGGHFMQRYGSVLLAAEDAYRNNKDPRKAVQLKIAQLREKQHVRSNGNGNGNGM